MNNTKTRPVAQKVKALFEKSREKIELLGNNNNNNDINKMSEEKHELPTRGSIAIQGRSYSSDPSGYVPYSESVKGLLTDLYQITMTYAYWKNGDMSKQAVFDLFFRKCPFKGEFCIFAGLDEVLRFLKYI